MKSGNLFKASGICMFASALILSNSVKAQDSNAQLQQEIKALQQEVSTLSGQVKQLQVEKERILQVQRGVVATQQRVVETQAEVVAAHKNILRNRQIEAIQQNAVPVKQATRQLAHQAFQQELATPAIAQPPTAPVTPLEAERITRGPTVTTSPYLGLRSAFDASDLVVNISTMNEDLRLLQQRETIEKAYRDAGLAPFVSDRPILEISGTLQAEGLYQDPFRGHATSAILLDKAEFDMLSYVSPWVLGIMTFTYDSGSFPALTNPGIQIVGTGNAVFNSRIFLKRGFITIGDLHQFPVYLTMGQMFAPFGDYTSQLLDNPLTAQLGQTNQRIALLGIAPYQTGFYLQGYIFNGGTFVSNPNALANGGGNIGYKHTFESHPITFNIGGGVIANLADSIGMQLVSSPTFGGPPSNAFQGFAFSSATEQLFRRVPGVDAHGELDIGKLTLVGEYIGATQAFDPRNLSWNWGGAEPKAMHVEGDYSFTWNNWPSVFTLAYDHSWEALGLFLPKDSYIAELTTSIFKDTIEALEIRQDANYQTMNFAFGNGFPIPVNSLGGGQTTIMLQAGYYF